jgi:molecular chaperone DnaK (HSP70)
MPMIGRIFHERFNQDLNAGIPSEEAIVHGAAVLGSVFEPGNEINCGCVDVAPLTLGIETKGGLMTTLVPRYSIIPTRKSHV